VLFGLTRMLTYILLYVAIRNIHGMPLSAALGEDNFDCQVNEINPDTAQRWEDLKNIGVHGTKISPENLIYFGVRDTEEAERKPD
jgi:arginase